MTDEEREVAMEKALKAMTAFSNKYVQNTNTYYCEDKSIPAVVIKGLAEHKVTLGTPLCPCRFYEDKEKEAKEVPDTLIDVEVKEEEEEREEEKEEAEEDVVPASLPSLPSTVVESPVEEENEEEEEEGPIILHGPSWQS